MALDLARKLGGFWADGIPLRQVFAGRNRPTGVDGPVAGTTGRAAPAREPASVADAALALVPPEILAGPHGGVMRRAVASRQAVTEMLARMTPKDRAMLPPDVEHTVQALVERVLTVGATLHRLDADANGSSLGSLDVRLARLRTEPAGTDRDRRLALLERQRATLADLVSRRATLLTQFESAATALETLKLDLVRFRSAGVSSALDDVSSATREARAVSREIGHLLDAADEVRRL
jgi:serine/threonine-protein kinase